MSGRWAEKHPGELVIPRRDVWQGVKGGRFERDSDLELPLLLLVEHNYLAEQTTTQATQKGGQRRGRPSRSYLINPHAFPALSDF